MSSYLNESSGATGTLKEETLKLLGQFRVEVDPRLDEQQLIDDDVIGRLVESAEVGMQDHVLDIGAGCGNITVALAKIAGKVFAIEKNPKFIPILQKRVADIENVTIIKGDALRIRLPGFNKIASNLPYAISEPLLQRLLPFEFQKATLITSQSFAETLTAKPTDHGYSKLTFVTSAFFEIDPVEDIGPDAYLPPPLTNTSMITLKPKEPVSDRQDALRRTLLQGDKKLKNALREAIIASSRVLGGTMTKRRAKDLIRSMHLSSSLLERRVARLSLEELRGIYERL